MEASPWDVLSEADLEEEAARLGPSSDPGLIETMDRDPLPTPARRRL